MPVRTSLVVACGLGLLTLIGVGAVFGESLVALMAPPRADGVASVEPRDRIAKRPAAAKGTRQTAGSPAVSSAGGSVAPAAPPDSGS